MELYKQTTPIGIAFYCRLDKKVRGNLWWWQEAEPERDEEEEYNPYHWWMCGNENPADKHGYVLTPSNELEYLVITGRVFDVKDVGKFWSDK
jgi:hypothetical protein